MQSTRGPTDSYTHAGPATQDPQQQHKLLSLLYDKIAIEHRKTNSGLFLALDEDRSGRLTRTQFKEGLAAMGAALSDAQVAWLLRTFDANKDDEIDYGEFVRMITQWRAGSGGVAAAAAAGTGTTKTGLDWQPEPFGSPFKAADEAREAVSE